MPRFECLTFTRRTEQVHEATPVAVECLVRLVVPWLERIERLYVEIRGWPLQYRIRQIERKGEPTGQSGVGDLYTNCACTASTRAPRRWALRTEADHYDRDAPRGRQTPRHPRPLGMCASTAASLTTVAEGWR